MLINDFLIKPFPVFSDHLLCILKLNISSKCEQNSPICIKMKLPLVNINTEKLNKFKNDIMFKGITFPNDNNIENLYEQFYLALKSEMLNSGILIEKVIRDQNNSTASL